MTHISPKHYDHWDGEYRDTIQNEYNSTYCVPLANTFENSVGHKLDNYILMMKNMQLPNHVFQTHLS